MNQNGTMSGAMIVDWPNSRRRRQQSAHSQGGDGRTAAASNPSSSSSSNGEGNVRFSHTTGVQFIQGLCEYTDEEWVATWYTEEEYSEIKRETRRTVRAMRKAHSKGIKLGESFTGTTGSEECTRGLEHLASTAELKAKQEKQDQVIMAVLSEQEHQRHDGRSDAYAIAFASSMCSKLARDTASKDGASDEAEARVLHNDYRARSSLSSTTVEFLEDIEQRLCHVLMSKNVESADHMRGAHSRVRKLQESLKYAFIEPKSEQESEGDTSKASVHPQTSIRGKMPCNITI